ncbi:uncharacterized protein LOC134787124 [Penaeus indicus]|uniref:uncharacterized protein LOC134787124 n=1 Tax=Penaeus indicus TaxID=29960 RepID=UPI00300D078C
MSHFFSTLPLLHISDTPYCSHFFSHHTFSSTLPLYVCFHHSFLSLLLSDHSTLNTLSYSHLRFSTLSLLFTILFPSYPFLHTLASLSTLQFTLLPSHFLFTLTLIHSSALNSHSICTSVTLSFYTSFPDTHTTLTVRTSALVTLFFLLTSASSHFLPVHTPNSSIPHTFLPPPPPTSTSLTLLCFYRTFSRTLILSFSFTLRFPDTSALNALLMHTSTSPHFCSPPHVPGLPYFIIPHTF